MNAPFRGPDTFPVAGPESHQRFFTLFGGADHYGTYDPARIGSGSKDEIKKVTRTVWEPATPALLALHLAGKQAIGVPPVRPDGTCSWGAIDVDDYQIEHGEFAGRLAELQLPLLVCRSKSGGAHLYLFADAPVPGAIMVAALQRIVPQLGLKKEPELFPSKAEPSGSGWLNMPYFRGDDTDRHCVKATGNGMTVGEFLRVAEQNRLSSERIKALAVSRGTSAPRTAPTPRAGKTSTPLEYWTAQLQNAPGGDANNTLTKAAFAMGPYVRDGDVGRDVVRQVLLEAWCDRGKDEAEFRDVFDRQLRQGELKGSKSTTKATGPRLESAEPVVTCLADVTPKPIRWLWPNRFALGKVAVLAGHPGVGKSQLAIWMAARVTTGGAWPFSDAIAPKGRVVMLSAEDDCADTIRPRFDAAGAAVELVSVIETMRNEKGERTFDLGEDIAKLDEVVSRLGNVRLVVIDPITAYLGKIDSNRAGDVRGVLAPLQRLAEKHDVAVLCVSHLIKAGGRSAIGSVTGSGSFVAAARTACLVTKEIVTVDDGEGSKVKEETGRRLLTVAKNNIGPDGAKQALAYNVVGRVNPGGIETTLVEWDEEVCISADDALASGEPGGGLGGSSKQRPRDTAIAFLAGMLRDGPVSYADIMIAAEVKNIKPDTLNNAKRELGIVSTKRSSGGWSWALSNTQPELPI